MRLFEAAACAVPVISDAWDGLETFFRPGREIVVAHETRDVLLALADTGEPARRALGRRARERVLAEHRAEARAVQLERDLEGALSRA